MVLRTAMRDRAAETPAPPLVVLAGGKGGVGATTAAVNVAVTLARQGQRIVLVDADLNQPDATAQCRLSESGSLAEVLAGQRTVHEVLQRGPAGIQILPGAWGQDTPTECTPLAQQRMLVELRRLGPHADLVVLDAGSGTSATASRFWQAADLALFVTTAEPTAITDCYAAIKVLLAQGFGGELHTLVNKARSDAQAADVAGRIEQACVRFLGRPVTSIAAVPFDAAVGEAAQAERPFVLQSPEGIASEAIAALAEQIQQSADLLLAHRRAAS